MKQFRQFARFEPTPLHQVQRPLQGEADPGHRDKIEKQDISVVSMMPDSHTDVALRVRVPYGN